MFKLVTCFLSIILCCGLLMRTASCAYLPSEVQKCPPTNNDKCVAETITKILRLYPHGNPEFGMADTSRLTARDIVVAKSRPDAPVQLNLKFNELIVKGIENSTILSASGIYKNLTAKFEFDIFLPELELSGQHEIGGKILILSLNGKGKANILLKDSRAKLAGKLEVEKRGGKDYAVIKKMRGNLEPKSFISNMEDLVQGNPELTASLNQVINENWKDIWNEMRKGISSALAQIMKDCINDILKEVSVDDMFLD